MQSPGGHWLSMTRSATSRSFFPDEWRTGPTSTVTGGMIVNMIRCRVAELLVEKGKPPVLLPSHQFVGNTSAQEQLERFYEAYRTSLAHLYR